MRLWRDGNSRRYWLATTRTTLREGVVEVHIGLHPSRMNVAFEWDPDKAARNLRKHRVSFAEAMTVFADPLRSIDLDDGHSHGEERWRVAGRSIRQRLLVVSFTEVGDVVRIISARPATPREVRLHER